MEITVKYEKKANGFTFLEIIFAVAIIGILAAIAVPAYSEYIKQTRLSNAAQKAEHLKMLLNDYWEDNNTYVDGNDATLQTKLGWHPGDSSITSTVEAGPDGIGTSFKITTTHTDIADEPVIIRYARD